MVKRAKFIMWGWPNPIFITNKIRTMISHIPLLYLNTDRNKSQTIWKMALFLWREVEIENLHILPLPYYVIRRSQLQPR